MKQRGFTLVELAIVLAIIGVVLLSVLKNQGLIGSADAKNIIVMVDDLRAATTYFKQRYNYLPGDLPPPNNEFAGVTNVGNGDGSIGVVDDINAQGQAIAGSESEAVPLQLFRAGLIGKINNSDTTPRITTSYGTVNLVSNATANGLVAGFAAANPAARNAIVFFKLPCDIVSEADSKIDNGVTESVDPNTGAPGGRAFGTACTDANIVLWYAVAL